MERFLKFLKATALVHYDYIMLRRLGFIIKVDEEVYLITSNQKLFNFYGRFQFEKAVIIVCDLENEELPNRFIDLDLSRIKSEGNFRENKDAGIIAFKVSELNKKRNYHWSDGVTCNEEEIAVDDVALSIDDLISFEDVVVGRDIFTCNYPDYNFKSENLEETEEDDSYFEVEKHGALNGIHYGWPLLRRGMVAIKDDRESTVILDAISYNANLGAPVISKQMEDGELHYRVIGMLGKPIQNDDAWLRPEEEHRVYNSRFTYAISTDVILKLFEDEF